MTNTSRPKKTAQDCAALIRQLLPNDFRVAGHQLEGDRHATVKIRTLDNETYLRIDAELLELEDAPLTEQLRPKVEDVIAHLRAAAPQS